MHKLLSRQLRQTFGSESDAPANITGFIDLVDRAYAHADADRTLLERSIETLSNEMVDRYKELRDALGRSRDAETNLQRTLSALKATLDATTDGILLTDAAGSVVLWNQRCRLIWSLPDHTEQDVDRHLMDVIADSLAEPGPLASRLAELADRPADESFDTLTTKDDRTIEAYSQPRRSVNGMAGRVWSFRDVTARRQLEERLRHRHRIEAVGELAGGVAHDFNNLLTVICACGEYLGQLIDDGPAREELDQIADAANRAAQLTRQLLAFSRRQVVRPVIIDAANLVRGLQPMLRRLIGEELTFRVSTEPHGDPVLVDPGQLEQVILNLVVNARDALRGSGTITIETANVGVAAGAVLAADGTFVPAGSYLRLAVRDTGVGISPDALPRIFDPFFTTKPTGEGTGLGLATVATIVRSFDGAIAVATEPGRGTTFTVYLPSAAGVDADGSGPRRLHAELEGTETVLVVEDDESVRSIVVRTLRRTGYQALLARNAHDALDIAVTRPVDLVLSDVVMPGMSGLELRDALRDACPGVQVLLMSGYTDAELTRRGTPVTGADIIPKPFTGRALLAAVRASLDAAQPTVIT